MYFLKSQGSCTVGAGGERVFGLEAFSTMSAIISSADSTSLTVLDLGGEDMKLDRVEGCVFSADAPDSGALYLALGGRIGTEPGITTFAVLVGVAAAVDLFSPLTETPSCLGAGGDSVGAPPPLLIGLFSPFANTAAF
jgi:hypothetical protein